MRITLALLRKRAEHNEGCLTDLKEIALHQQEIERIEVIGDTCRQMEILYLSNNYIPKIEGLVHMKCLKYLNLAINNIKTIEGLEGCEGLEKLDLTLNFIADLESIRSLRANPNLAALHLTGNPCCNVPGYRRFVIQSLPQLVSLDGKDVTRSEIIEARQEMTPDEVTAAVETMKAREEARLKEEMIAKGIDPFPPRYNEKGERMYGHSAEERLQMLRENQAEEEKRKNPPKVPGSISALHEEMTKKPVKLTPEEEIEKYGHVRLRNEAQVPFRMDEQEEYVDLFVQPGKFIATSLIEIAVQPTYVRVVIKGKVLQLEPPESVSPDGVKVERSQTTGELKIRMPFAAHILERKRAKKAALLGNVD